MQRHDLQQPVARHWLAIPVRQSLVIPVQQSLAIPAVPPSADLVLAYRSMDFS